MATKITIDNTSGNVNYESSPITPQTYDIAGELTGAPPVTTRIFDFKAVRAYTLKTGGVAGCVTGPTGGSVTYDIKKITAIGGGVSTIGSIQFLESATTGTVSIASDVNMLENDILYIESPVDVKSMDTLFWTFNGLIS